MSDSNNKSSPSKKGNVGRRQFTMPEPKFTPEEYLNLTRDIVKKFKIDLLAYSAITPEYIMSRFKHDVSLGRHLVERYQTHSQCDNQNVPQVALFMMEIDSECRKQLFYRIAFDPNSDRLCQFFHWIVCMCAPDTFKKMFQSLNLSETEMNTIISNWENKDNIQFFYGLDTDKQELIMKTYADQYYLYDTDRCLLQRHIFSQFLDM